MENWIKINKKGATYIVEQGTIDEFRVKYNQDSYRIGSTIKGDVRGYILTNGEEDFWFVSEEYLWDNYDIDGEPTVVRIKDIKEEV